MSHPLLVYLFIVTNLFTPKMLKLHKDRDFAFFLLLSPQPLEKD